MLLNLLYEKKLIDCPSWVVNNCVYITLTGSRAYGCNTPESDYDYYGIVVPPKNVVFPHLAGYIEGFGSPRKTFEDLIKHEILIDKKEYGIHLMNIVKFFELCRNNNPNVLGILYTHSTCVNHCTKVGQIMKDNRKHFLSKKVFTTFRGYANSQRHKIMTKNPKGERKELVGKFGYDTKYAYNIIRLLDECLQLLTEYDLDLMKSKDVLKSIRKGEWSLEKIFQYSDQQELLLQKALENTKLPIKPNEEKLKTILMECLEEHYGSLEFFKREEDLTKLALQEIDQIISKYRTIIY